MDINGLKLRGAFVEGPPVEEEVSWVRFDHATGHEVVDRFTVFVLRQSVEQVEAMRRAGREHEDVNRTALIIAEGLRFGEGGQEKMSYEDACRLDMGLASELLKAFNRGNVQDASPKNSVPQTSSGVSSSSAASVDAP